MLQPLDPSSLRFEHSSHPPLRLHMPFFALRSTFAPAASLLRPNASPPMLRAKRCRRKLLRVLGPSMPQARPFALPRQAHQAVRCSKPPHRAFGSLNARSAHDQIHPSPPPVTNSLFLQRSRLEPLPRSEPAKTSRHAQGHRHRRFRRRNRSISHIGKGTTRLRRPIGSIDLRQVLPDSRNRRQRLVIALS